MIVISSTVTLTATGYLANEAVDVTLAGPNANATAPLPFGAPAPPPGTTTCPATTVAVGHANGAGTLYINFIVPENCDTVTYNTGYGVTNSNGELANAGATVTLWRESRLSKAASPMVRRTTQQCLRPPRRSRRFPRRPTPATRAAWCC